VAKNLHQKMSIIRWHPVQICFRTTLSHCGKTNITTIFLVHTLSKKNDVHYTFHRQYYIIISVKILHSRSLIVGRPDAESSCFSFASVYDLSPDPSKFTFVVPRPDVIESSALQQPRQKPICFYFRDLAIFGVNLENACKTET